jgi:hypothetical protein
VDADRRSAIVTGVLFILATAAALASTALTNSILTASDYLTKISANQNQVVLGALFQFIGSAASASIAISLYPILRRYNEGLALGSVGFRLIEAVFGAVAALCLLTLVSVSQDYVSATASNASYFQTLGTVLKAAINWASFVFLALAFTLGALLYYYIFYQSRLIPRWLSAWGLIAAALSLSVALLIMFGTQPLSTITIVLNVPIAVQEMVLAVWLIVKGFNPAVLVPAAARPSGKHAAS